MPRKSLPLIAKSLQAIIILATLFFSTQNSLARKTDFKDSHQGLVFGVGRFLKLLDQSQYQHDPISQMTNTDDTFTNLQGYNLHPSRAGIFWGGPYSTFQIYGRFVFSNKTTWNRLDAPTGVGRTTIKGKGAGAQLDLMLLSTSSARVMLSAMGEYIIYKAFLEFQPDLDNKENISLTSSNIIWGAGFSGEVYLVDLWVLSVFAGYFPPTSGKWKVNSPGGDMFDVPRSPGNLMTADGESKTNAKFGGIAIEATLRLNFHFL